MIFDTFNSHITIIISTAILSNSQSYVFFHGRNYDTIGLSLIRGKHNINVPNPNKIDMISINGVGCFVFSIVTFFKYSTEITLIVGVKSFHNTAKFVK